MLKQFISHRRQSAIFAQKRIGIPAIRKYTFANSANGSLYAVRRLTTSRRLPRTCSQTELIVNESTNRSAAFLTASGMRRPKGCLSGGDGCGEAMVVINPHILRYDSM